MVRSVGLLLAGGTGTRLYPASLPGHPKQFLAFDGERSLLRRTADRLDFLDELYAVTRSRYRDRVAAIVPEATVLTDPGRDTGPAIVTAVHDIATRESTDVPREVIDIAIGCFPTDHTVGADGFRSSVDRAMTVAAKTGDLVCLGVDPTRPAPDYGYLKPAAQVSSSDPGAVDVPVDAFHEKPDPDRARELVEAGWYWNAGIFVWTPAALLREAARSPLAALVDALGTGGSLASVPELSIDYAVLERTDRARVLPCDFPWNDLGTWDAVGREFRAEDGKDSSNTVLGRGVTLEAADNVIASEDHHVSVCGVDGLVVAAYDDRVLVVPRENSDRVRAVVDELRERGELE